ncbi:MAG: hypothetical protein KGJ43_01140 [Acidobacteriota bacterium]|nr:hypothetical protein [Acidobacteriota bacterium]
MSLSASGVEAHRPPVVLRYLDLIALAIAAAPVLSAGVPSAGFLTGALAWTAQRALAEADARWIMRPRTPRAKLGLTLFEAFARIWLLAGAIVAAGVIGGRADGLAAGLVIFCAYSIAFAVKVVMRPPPPAGLRGAGGRR